MTRRRSESKLAALRKLAQRLARERSESTTTVHLLAAVCATEGPARELLVDRRMSEGTALKAARSFDERIDDAMAVALQTARGLAQRAAVPSRASFVSSHGGPVRPAAAAEADGVHLLVALLSNRQLAAHRALEQCGVDIARLRAAATRVALGLVAPPRRRRDAERRRASDPKGARVCQPPDRASGEGATRDPARVRHRSSPPSCRRVGSSSRAVAVPLLPPMRPPSSSRPDRTDRLEASGAGAAGGALAMEAPMAGSADREIEPALPTPPASAPDPIAAPPAESLPVLSAIGRDLTAVAARGEMEPVIGRQWEVEQLRDVLAKRHANCPLLVGPAGVGKTSVARALAATWASEASVRGGPRLIELPVADLLAGTGARGSLAERLASVCAEVRRAEGRVVLFIDDVHELVAGGAEEALSELKAAMARGELPVLATTTLDEQRRTIEQDAALARRFTVVEVREPDESEAFLLLRSVCDGLSSHHGVAYSDEAIAVAVSWSIRYLPARALPDKAVAILDLAGARLARRAATDTRATVQPEQVAVVVSELSEVPVERLLETDQERMLAAERLLSERVVGHDQACARIAAILRRNAAGLRGRRPIGSFLLLGPTGVGKTETAKAIAAALFHNPDALTRLDMSEYAEAHAVARVVGAPPGYVGHESGGLLTEAVRKRPYQVVLLDEIEKAHREVLQSFLQVFDEGRLTDGRGRTVDFTHTVLVLTSNLGSVELDHAMSERRVGFAPTGSQRRDPSELGDIAIRAARAELPPELYNRIDEVIFFRPLDRQDVRTIARRLLDELAAKLELRGVGLQVESSVVELLLDSGGYDPQLGARPLRRALARLVEAPLADLILKAEIGRGGVALVSVDEGRITVDVLDPRERRSA